MAFNLIEFVIATDDLDGVVLVCNIQPSSVIVARYLLSSRKTMNDAHWDMLLKNNPKL